MITNGQRNTGFSLQKINGFVVDSILAKATVASRFIGRGQEFSGIAEWVTMDIELDGDGEWYQGMPTFNLSVPNTTVTAQYTDVAYAKPTVSVMLDSFRNAGPGEEIKLDVSRLEKSIGEAINDVGSAIYSTAPSADMPISLEQIVDNGTIAPTIGGLSRSTYPVLNSTVTSIGTLTLEKLAQGHDAASQYGEDPTIHVVPFAVFSYYEDLLNPTVRANYDMMKLPVRGDDPVQANQLRGMAGFSYLAYRGMPVIKDYFCTAGRWFMLNEKYLKWKGRNIVPPEYKDVVSKISLGKPTQYKGPVDLEDFMPSENHGFFFEKWQKIPDQPGMVAYYHLIGQMIPYQFRNMWKGTGITGA